MCTKKKIIIRVDGGFCSQLFFIALGHHFEQQGAKVKYDLCWFDKYGKDMDNKFDRSYVLHHAFPKMKVRRATKFEVWIYRHFFKSKWSEYKFPNRLYINGYPPRDHLVQRYKNYFISEFNPIDKDRISDLLEMINKPNACAVHVRRGDLAKINEFYGMPPTKEYFLRAIDYVKQQIPNVKFFFFSDEMNWVKENIVPAIPKDTVYHLCDKNGSDKGYLDVFLISHAAAIIASQGSFGPTGLYLNRNKDVVYVSQKTFQPKENAK